MYVFHLELFLKLNMYNFHKIRNENNETEFRHILF